MRSLLVLGATATLLVSLPARGQTPSPQDAAGAREELKRGFALRRQDQCAEAIPHLAESFRLDPQVKALLNLADCEERVGRLVDAGQHWKQARELGDAQANAAMKQEAGNRLDALERRLPHLTIVLAPGAPASLRVTRDGADVAAASLGTRLPVDPGRHVIEVSLEGHETSVAQATLAEHDDVRLEVAPGPERPVPAPSAPAVEVPTVLSPAPASPVVAAEPSPSARGPLGYTGIVLGATGVVGLGVGAVEWLLAQQRHDDAITACQPNCSAPAALQLQSQARDESSTSTVMLVAGGAVAAVGVALFVIDSLRAAKAAPASRAAHASGSLALRGAQIAVTW